MENNPAPVNQSPTLPPELLIMIFNRTVTPDFLLQDSSLSSRLDDPWYRSQKTKLSISMVCKSWHAVGIEFLYEDIVFQHLTQLPAFLRTLVTAHEKYQHLIKRITIHTLVPPQDGASFTKCLQDILNRCPSVRRFSFLSPSALPSTAALPTLSFNITHLSFNDTTPAALHLLHCTSNSLISLTISESSSASASALTIGADGPFLLPNLEDFFLNLRLFHPRDQDPSHTVTRTLQLLEVPRLRRLAINSADCPSEISTLLQRCGQQVRVLFLERSWHWPAEKIKSLLDACPILEHVVFQETPNGLTKYSSITHPTVKWLDVWALMPKFYTLDDALTPTIRALVKTMFPRVEHVRYINVWSTGIQRAVSLGIAPDLNHLIASEDDSPSFDFPGIQLRCKLGHIVAPRPPSYEDSDSDSDHIDASSDEGSNSDSEDSE
ncbi:hypothetical protein H0H92_004669 [Tricholoma furcatifolium]|nr:hypothetical protein H0H92_004669 [Tricholoma furcatifolium]